jgi:hypothetical protein
VEVSSVDKEMCLGMCPHLAEWRLERQGVARWFSASHGRSRFAQCNGRNRSQLASNGSLIYLQLKLNLSAHLARGKEPRKIMESNGLASNMHAYISHVRSSMHFLAGRWTILVSKSKTRKDDGTWLGALFVGNLKLEL